jgi:hypothetical protein
MAARIEAYRVALRTTVYSVTMRSHTRAHASPCRSVQRKPVPQRTAALVCAKGRALGGGLSIYRARLGGWSHICAGTDWPTSAPGPTGPHLRRDRLAHICAGTWQVLESCIALEPLLSRERVGFRGLVQKVLGTLPAGMRAAGCCESGGDCAAGR